MTSHLKPPCPFLLVYSVFSTYIFNTGEFLVAYLLPLHKYSRLERCKDSLSNFHALVNPSLLHGHGQDKHVAAGDVIAFVKAEVQLHFHSL